MSRVPLVSWTPFQFDVGLLEFQIFQLSDLYLYETHLMWMQGHIWACSALGGKAWELLDLHLSDVFARPSVPSSGCLQLSEIRWIPALNRNTWKVRFLPNHSLLLRTPLYCTVEWLLCPHSLLCHLLVLLCTQQHCCLSRMVEESAVNQLLVQVGHLGLKEASQK